MMLEQNHEATPILVIGLPRSGTSAVAGALGECGAWLGKTSPGRGPANPKGSFEHLFLREEVNKHILRALDVDPLGVRWLPPLPTTNQVSGLREMVLAGIRKEGYTGSTPWLFKDAKTTLIWPIWHEAFPQARWIIVRRRSEDIIRSCLRTDFMADHSTNPKFWEQHIESYMERIDVLKQNVVWWKELSSDELMRGDFVPLNELVDALQLRWNEKGVREFIEPRFWHGDHRQLYLPFEQRHHIPSKNITVDPHTHNSIPRSLGWSKDSAIPVR